MTLLEQTLEIVVENSKTMTKEQFKEYYIAVAGMFTEEEGKGEILSKGEELLEYME
ncbi:MAG: hypothetical protein N4A68_11815 [Maledivibacter sp.]|jgi:hypothetical protein|nr:hypothetical protein [Maledivibacter sp.]